MRKALMALAAVAAMAFAPAGASADDGQAPLKIDGATTVDADSFIALFRSTPELVVIDSRKPADYRDAHIQEAVNLPNTETTEAALAEVVSAKDTPVAFYCNGLACGRAADAVRKAVSFGYENVHYYAKGMDEWNERGLPTVSE